MTKGKSNFGNQIKQALKPSPRKETMNTTHEKYIERVRQRFGRYTPFRLGMEVGRAGDTLPSPYHEKTQANKLYMDGLEAGTEMRKRQLEMQLEDQGREFT